MTPARVLDSDSVERSLQQRLLAARNSDGGWGLRAWTHVAPRATCWALLALHTLRARSDQILRAIGLDQFRE